MGAIVGKQFSRCQLVGENGQLGDILFDDALFHTIPARLHASLYPHASRNFASSNRSFDERHKAVNSFTISIHVNILSVDRSKLPGRVSFNTLAIAMKWCLVMLGELLIGLPSVEVD
jgi:hypothetical protein